MSSSAAIGSVSLSLRAASDWLRGIIGHFPHCIRQRRRFMIAPPRCHGYDMSSTLSENPEIGRNRLPLPYLAGALVVCLLCACTGQEYQQPSPEALALAADLRTEMARCVDAQQASDQRLEQQGQQLSAQAEQLEKMTTTLIALEAGQRETIDQTPTAVPSCEQKADMPGKMLVGRQELVWLEDFQLMLPARVDTGAETASLDARNIELFERNSDDWVRFEIVHPESGEAIPLERELVRKARIVQASSEEAERRPVISLGIVIGDVRQQAEFTLSNRSHLDYQVLVGRNILADVMIVDVSQTNIAPPAGVNEESAATAELP